MSVVGAALRGFGKALRGKGKVSPTIKSVKPNLKKTVKQSKADEHRKRYQALDKSDAKVKKGREMMREGQRERRRMVDTGRAFQFKHSRSYHAIDPADREKYISQTKTQKPSPKFKKGKELDREKKAIGGLARATKKLRREMAQRRKRMGRPGQSERKRPSPKPSPRRPRPKTYPPKRIMQPLAKGGRSFPDLSGDGKVTKKDVLIGRGVIKK